MEDFNRIIGNESIKEFFHSSMEHKRVSHAYILEGEKGCGKKTIAQEYARILQCESEGQRPCGKCTSCIQMDNKDHPDVIWVTHEKKDILVDDVRKQIVNTIEIKPYRGPYKIYIVDEAEKMNEKAQNAILKTIEEPSEYAIIFLLTTNRGAFLQTILSRCILLSIKPLKTDLIKKYLMDKQSLDEGMAGFYASFAMGNLGKAIAISSSEEFNEMRSHAVDFLRYIHEMEMDQLDDKVKTCLDYKAIITDYFDLMRMWYRDILLIKTTKERSNIIFKDSMMALSQQAKMLDLHAISEIFREIDDAGKKIRANGSFEAILDVMLLKIKHLFNDSE